MSSPENPSGSSEPSAEELSESPGAQAEIERTEADTDLEEAAAAGPPASTGGGEVGAPGAPGELSSDDDKGRDASEAAEPAGADVPEGDDATGRAPAAGGGAGAESSSVVPDQPAPTPNAAADASVGRQAEAAVADKEAQAAAAASTAGVSGDPAAPPVEAETEAEPEPEEVDEVRQPILDALRRHLGDDVVATHVVPGVDAWVRVRREAWRRAAEVCRNELGMTYFVYVSAIDWLPSPFGKSEDGGLGVEPGRSEVASGELEHGTTGGETRFQLIARLSSPKSGLGIHLKADVPDDDLVVESWTSLFAGANWHEREVSEMFGIAFAGHPNPGKLYLPGEFEGFPLRKDFPLLARDVKPWPGLVDVEPLPGEDEPAPTEAGSEA